MPREAELLESLERIREIVDAALVGNKRRTVKEKPAARNARAVKAQDGLQAIILRLRDAGKLRPPKTGTEVHHELQDEYPCAVDRVAMALLRLHKKKQLRKTSKKVGNRTSIAYTW